jgi:hypothetical protein
MATLTSNSLDGCTSIPNFLPTGTRMTFRNTLPPTSWTKETNSAYNDAALRLATGTVTLGGSSPFLTVFPASQKAVQGSVNSIQSSVSVAQNTAPLSAQTSSTPTNPTTVWQSVTLSIAQIPAHNHSYARHPNGAARGMALQPGARGIAYQVSDFSTNQNNAVSGHNHAFSVGHSHAHGASSTQHNHPISSFGTHNHGFTATTSQDFAISYVDIIIAIKG